MTTPGGSAPEGAYVFGSDFGQGVPNSESGVMAMVKGKQTAPWSGAQNAFKTNGVPLSQQLEMVNNHTAQLSAIQETIEAQILQGLAVVFTASGWWKPPRNLVYADLIGVAAGGGGAAGKWNVNPGSQRWGCGGGGGGETHLDNASRLYASFLPKTGEDFDWIRVDMYLAGPGGVGSEAAGTGGGNIVFGANLPQPIVTFQGGVGGMNGWYGGGGAGGAGMIAGGRGGDPDGAGRDGGNSASPYTFSGGGGGGGAGWIASGTGAPGYGGSGVATPGGAPGQPGIPPNPIIAAGGSGGGGARNSGEPGGAGGFPGGGGGGGFGGLTSASNGGKGGEAKLWIVETKSGDQA